MHRFPAALLLGVLCALCLPGCRGGGAQSQGASAPGGRGAATAGAPASERISRLDLLLTQWDAAQFEGRVEQARMLEQQLRTEVDGAFAELGPALEGRMGLPAQYMAASALGFSSRRESTGMLVKTLSSRDARLVANALIALKLRADPDTPLEPVLPLISPAVPEGPRRYAPLVLAHVLVARARRGQAPDPRLENEAAARLAALATDRDAIVRLHAARALGALRSGGGQDSLLLLAKDSDLRVRWAAAAALERVGDARGFPEVVRLLHETPMESKHVIRDLLVSYAARLQGRPLGATEVDALGIGARAWTEWYDGFVRSRTGS